MFSFPFNGVPFNLAEGFQFTKSVSKSQDSGVGCVCVVFFFSPPLYRGKSYSKGFWGRSFHFFWLSGRIAQFIPTLVFLNYVLFSPSPRKINNRKNPTFVTSFHLTFSQLPWRCHQVRSSPWMGLYWINVADWNLWPMKPGFTLGWVVLNIDHPPLCQKKSMVICLASFCIFWGDGF